MKNRNKESTRYYSQQQEDHVAKVMGGHRIANSGAVKFSKGDVCTNRFLFECKTAMEEKDSFSIKKEWIEKNRLEAFQTRKDHSVVVFNFGPQTENHYIISESLMKVLVDYIEGENQ